MEKNRELKGEVIQMEIKMFQQKKDDMGGSFIIGSSSKEQIKEKEEEKECKGGEGELRVYEEENIPSEDEGTIKSKEFN